ncbi:LUD domain-containing protein [Kitasatospora sp. SUK 42]|nr:LUD domain-containing protein [Kitasatospora sp. SUK 42]
MDSRGVVFLGSPAFPEAARTALADGQLRANLKRATSTIRDKRLAVASELDDWEALRESAAAIKKRTARHLDRYLVRLEQSVTAAGGTVHWASDAAEANRIVTELVRATGEREVVKVKSMATQEIGLNEHLAGAGITAYETDLAELIVQLGDDRPSHILVPAIHRNRTEIREIFAARMGEWGQPAPEGLGDAPAELAEAARRQLREKFLTAKVAATVLDSSFLLAVAQKAAALGGRALARRGRIGRLHGWSDTRDTPAPPAQSFRSWWRENKCENKEGQ